MSASVLPSELSQPLVEQVVHAFYGRIRSDHFLGPIFEERIGDRWDVHLATMVDFWSSVALRSGRYAGKPHIAHQGFGIEPQHFSHWLVLFEKTIHELCCGAAAEFFIDRAHRIADSLQIGLNIGPKALYFPAFAAAPSRTD